MIRDMYDSIPEGSKLRRRNKERLAELEAKAPERQARIKQVVLAPVYPPAYIRQKD